MKQLSRVVWSEGMHLGPHHFQVQSRFFEEITHFGISKLWFEPYGIVGLELDGEALRNGTVCVVHARGIFPDGLPFNMPESDPLPAPRGIADLFPPTRESLTVLIAIPPLRVGSANCALTDQDKNGATRLIAESDMVPDENTGTDEKPLKVGRKNIRILLDTEDVGDMQTLPIARIRRDGSGNYIYDEAFIPPCTQISASPTLMLMARRLIEVLQEKSATMSLENRGKGKFQAGFSAQEIGRFWFLHAINSSLGPLRHLFFTKRGHPEELFLELLRLGGALCTFSLDSQPRNLPLYNHMALDACFAELEKHIHDHLDLLAPSNCLSIPLKPVADYFYEGAITDQRCLDRARWMISVHSALGDADVINRTLQLVKVCSAQFVPQLVKRALPGMELTHVPVPPSAVARRVESQYFSVSRAGPCWDHIVQTRRVGIYIPGDIPNPEIELLVILES
ncbi:MAG: type VI secretion system baseplate subunit TssK [Acidobacteriota bacterium]|nr:type VI secretion system baseplate subunit TssK [Acidobacteriota bacterium]